MEITIENQFMLHANIVSVEFDDYNVKYLYLTICLSRPYPQIMPKSKIDGGFFATGNELLSSADESQLQLCSSFNWNNVESVRTPVL